MKNKGFTLIEMLVVIAVVGILSATLLTALGPARNKGRDARIVSGVNQLMALAETQFTGNSYPSSISELSGGAAIEADIKKYNGNREVTYSESGSNLAISSPLASGDHYCRDSSGKTGSGEASEGTCP